MTLETSAASHGLPTTAVAQIHATLSDAVQAGLMRVRLNSEISSVKAIDTQMDSTARHQNSQNH